MNFRERRQPMRASGAVQLLALCAAGWLAVIGLATVLRTVWGWL